MAGSIKSMIYIDDNDVQHAVRIDESNGEVAGFLDVTDESTAQGIPKGLTMRYVRVVEPATQASRIIYVGDKTNALFNGLAETVLLPLLGPLGTAATLTAFTVVQSVGEQVKRYLAADTGLTDGDAT